MSKWMNEMNGMNVCTSSTWLHSFHFRTLFVSAVWSAIELWELHQSRVFFSFHSIKAPLLVIYFYGCVCDSSHPFVWWSHYITIKPKKVRYRPKSTAKLKCHQQKPNKQRNNRMLYPYHRIGYSNNKLRYKLVFVCASHSLLPYFIMNVFLHHFSSFSLGIKSHEKLCRYSKVYFSDTCYRCVNVYGKWYIKSFFYSDCAVLHTNVCA